MNREEILREHTHKGDGLPTSQRCYYTLRPAIGRETFPSEQARREEAARIDRITTDRTAKLLCLLIEQLEHSGQLSPGQIDELLLGAAGFDPT